MSLKPSRLIAVVLICLWVGPTALAVTPQDYSVATPNNLQTGHLYGESCICIDAKTGAVLFEKDADARRYPASTTKIMTCILGIEHGPMGQMVTVPHAAEEIPNDSSKLGIVSGEVIKFDDLLYGLMLASGNDAANAIAVLTAGSVTKFVNMMNEKARALGCTNTTFANAHGYSNDGHYTTARDLALITQYAMKNATFREIVVQESYTMHPTNIHGEATIHSEYDLLIPGKTYYYEWCVGVKSGFTTPAGRCFVAAGVQNDRQVISVTMKTPTTDKKYMYIDSIRLMKYGFLQFQSVGFEALYQMCPDEFVSLSVKNAAEDDVKGGLLRPSIVSLSHPGYGESHPTVKLSDLNYRTMTAEAFAHRLTFRLSGNEIVAPVRAGDILGTIEYQTPSGEVITGTLVASRDVDAQPQPMSEWVDDWIGENAPWFERLLPSHNPRAIALYGMIGALCILLIGRRVVRNARFNRARKKLYYQRRRAAQRRAAQRRTGTAPRRPAGNRPHPSTSAPRRPSSVPPRRPPASTIVPVSPARRRPTATTASRNLKK